MAYNFSDKLLFLMLFTILISATSTISFNRSSLDPVLKYDSLADPWYINGNYALEQFATNNSVPGNGSQSNPYVFSNFTVTGASTDNLIEIANSDVHVVITDCNLEGGALGIFLRTVSNIEVSNCDISHNNVGGILARASTNLNISRNRLQFNGDADEFAIAYGMRFENSSDSLVSHNIIANNSDNGIYSTQDCYRLNIDRNNLTGNYIGITAVNTYLSIYFLNFIFFNVIGAFSLFNSGSNTISSNQFIKNGGSALHMSSCTDNTLENNSIIENELYGVDLFGCSETSIYNNDFFGNNLLQTYGPSQASEDDLGSSNDFLHNYFNEFTSPDNNSDGIVDVSYPIDGAANNSDPQPSVLPNNLVTTNYTTPTHLLSQPVFIYPQAGDQSYFETLHVEWNAAVDTLDHIIRYSIYLLPETNNTLEVFLTSTLELIVDLNISEIEDGDYRLKLIAEDDYGLASLAVSTLITIDNSIQIVTSTNDGVSDTDIATSPTSTTTYDTEIIERTNDQPSTNNQIPFWIDPIILLIGTSIWLRRKRKA